MNERLSRGTDLPNLQEYGRGLPAYLGTPTGAIRVFSAPSYRGGELIRPPGFLEFD